MKLWKTSLIKVFVNPSRLLVRTSFCRSTWRTLALCYLLYNVFPSGCFWPEGNVTAVEHVVACILTHGFKMLKKKTCAYLCAERDWRPTLRLFQLWQKVGSCLRRCLLRNPCWRRLILYVFMPRTSKSLIIYKQNDIRLVGLSRVTRWCRYVGA
jgi:hypothetical protein